MNLKYYSIIDKLCKKYHICSDIQIKIIKKFKDINANLIINKWYNFVFRKSILPTIFLTDLTTYPFLLHNNNCVNKIFYIEKNLNFNLIEDKRWLERKITKLVINSVAAINLLYSEWTGKEWNNYQIIKNSIFLLNEKLKKNNLSYFINLDL